MNTTKVLSITRNHRSLLLEILPEDVGQNLAHSLDLLDNQVVIEGEIVHIPLDGELHVLAHGSRLDVHNALPLFLPVDDDEDIGLVVLLGLDQVRSYILLVESPVRQDETNLVQFLACGGLGRLLEVLH